MTPISNAGILNILTGNQAAGFVPGASYVYDADAKTMTVTDTSALPDGDDLAVAHVRVYDEFGNKKSGRITAAEGNVVVNCATLDPLEGLSVTVQFVTDNGLTADAGAYKIGVGAPLEGDTRYTNIQG